MEDSKIHMLLRVREPSSSSLLFVHPFLIVLHTTTHHAHDERTFCRRWMYSIPIEFISARVSLLSLSLSRARFVRSSRSFFRTLVRLRMLTINGSTDGWPQVDQWTISTQQQQCLLMPISCGLLCVCVRVVCVQFPRIALCCVPFLASISPTACVLSPHSPCHVRFLY